MFGTVVTSSTTPRLLEKEPAMSAVSRRLSSGASARDFILIGG
jgi:hypothetical protein